MCSAGARGVRVPPRPLLGQSPLHLPWALRPATAPSPARRAARGGNPPWSRLRPRPAGTFQAKRLITVTAPRGHRTSVRAAIPQLHEGSSGTVYRSPAACESHAEMQHIWKPLGQPHALARRLLGGQLPERGGRFLLPRPLSPSLTLLHPLNGAQGPTFCRRGAGGEGNKGLGTSWGRGLTHPPHAQRGAGKPGARGPIDPCGQPTSRAGLTGIPEDL